MKCGYEVGPEEVKFVKEWLVQEFMILCSGVTTGAGIKLI